MTQPGRRGLARTTGRLSRHQCSPLLNWTGGGPWPTPGPVELAAVVATRGQRRHRTRRYSDWHQRRRVRLTGSSISVATIKPASKAAAATNPCTAAPTAEPLSSIAVASTLGVALGQHVGPQMLLVLRRATMLQIASTMTAPTTAPINPAPSPGRYQPRAWPSHVAMKAPTIPRMVVRMKPDGSLGPGWRNFAIKPATNPMIIVQMKPTLRSSRAAWTNTLSH